MRAGRMALYCDTQVVSLISGRPGNMIVKRSSRLENSFQSCANEVPHSANTRADDSNGSRRILRLQCRDGVQFLNSSVVFKVLLSIPVISVSRTCSEQRALAGTLSGAAERRSGKGTRTWR